MSTSICQSYLSHALNECSALASQFAERASPAVAVWQDEEYLVITASDGFRIHEFRIMLFGQNSAPTVLLRDRILSFAPEACAAVARALAKPLWTNEIMNAEYDDEKTTLSFISPVGLSLCLKANECSLKYDLRQFSAKFVEAERPHVIALSAAQALAALPKPRRGKDRDLTHVEIESNLWQVGETSGELCAVEQVQGHPRITLTMRYLREALEIAAHYAAECVVEIPNVNDPTSFKYDPVAVKFALGKALFFNAYVMPVRKVQP